jgi:hypothetical protein
MDSGGSDAGAPTPVGVAVEMGSVEILGVTNDGFIVYLTGTTVKAAPEAGGTAKTLLAAGDAGAADGLYVLAINDDVFIWSNANPTTGASTLTVWSSTLEAPTQVSTSSIPYVAAASSDSATVLFATNTSVDGSKVDIVGAPLTELTAPVTLVTGIDPGLGASSCPPFAAFSGTGASLYAVVSSCSPATTDGGADGPETVSSFLASTWHATVLSANATSYTLDSTGSTAAITLATGALETVSLTGGAQVVIETEDAGAGDATAAAIPPLVYLSQSDAFLLFNTPAGALMSSKVTTADPMTLLAANAADFDAISGDESYLVIDSGLDDTTALAMGLAITPTATPNSATVLLSGSNEGGIFGDGFTADSKYVVYLGNVTQDSLGSSVGTLMAAPVANPSNFVTVAMASGTLTSQGNGIVTGGLANTLAAMAEDPASPQSATDYALTGSKIAFADNFNSANGSLGEVDIEVVDLSTTTNATTVMKGADPLFVVTEDKKYIVYTVSFGAATDGLYSVPVP